MNKVILVGNLGSDVELRYTGSGRPVANFRLATNEYFKDKDGKSQQKTEWHRITVWGDRAERCAQYMSKGNKNVTVEGKLRYGSFDKDGVKHYTTTIEAMNVQFGTRPSNVAQDVGEQLSEDEQMDVPI